MAEKQKKGILKKLILVTLAFGVGIIAAGKFVPEVGQAIDDATGNILNLSGDHQELEQLSKVKNIKFNEETKEVSFDEVTNASGYEVTVENPNRETRYEYETTGPSAIIDIISDAETGDDLIITVVAKGDYEKYSDSEETTFETQLAIQDDQFYEEAEQLLYQSMLGDIEALRMGEITSINTIENSNGIVTINLTGYARTGEEVDVEVVYDFEKQGIEVGEIDSAQDFLAFADQVVSVDLENISSSFTFSDQMLDLTDALSENSALISSYVNQGYSVKLLQQSYSQYTQTEDGIQFEINSIFAFEKDGAVFVVGINNTVEMEHNELYSDVEQYAGDYNAGSPSITIDDSVKNYDSQLMKGLRIIGDIHTQTTEQAQEQAD